MKKTTRKAFSVFLLAVIALLFIVMIVCLPYWACAEATEQLPVSPDLLEAVKEYAVTPVVIFCCIVGTILKNGFEKFNNKLIPVVLIPVGVVGVLWINGWVFTPDTVFAGVCSAVASIGLHSGGKNTIEALKTALKPPEQ